MSLAAVELIYRGVFQKTLADRICRTIALTARNAGGVGIVFSRYSDSPERNGIPAKRFAVVADDQDELQASMAMYQPSQIDVSIVLDDTLCKGIESWAWDGLHAIHSLVKENGTLIVVSERSAVELLNDIHRRGTPYNLAVAKGQASFSGFWVFNDDHSDLRVLGALAHACPQILERDFLEKTVLDQWHDQGRVESLRRSYGAVEMRLVKPGEGNAKELYRYNLLTMQEMEPATVIRGAPQGLPFQNETGGYRSGRNLYYRKYPTRSIRPLIDFDRCTKCGMCWILCPDGSFDVTPEGYRDVNMDSCAGCGICADVCPVKCITMINEGSSADTWRQFETWQRSKEDYGLCVKSLIESLDARPSSHGLHHWGQYKENRD